MIVDTKAAGKLQKRCGKTIKPVHHEFGGARTNSVMSLLSKQLDFGFQGVTMSVPNPRAR